MLAKDVWRETNRATPLDNVIDVHGAHLRRKVDEVHAVKLIQTVRGVGFVLRGGGGVMTGWWQRRTVRVRLAAWFAATGFGVRNCPTRAACPSRPAMPEHTATTWAFHRQRRSEGWRRLSQALS